MDTPGRLADHAGTATAAGAPELPHRIMIVEDEPFIATGMHASLRAAGFEVVAMAASIREALAVAERHEVDAVVLDARLPDGSSAVIADALRAMGVPFVVVTGHAADQIGDWVGDARLLSKPVRVRDLVGEVRRLVSGPAGSGTA